MGPCGVHTDALKAALADRFYALQVRDRTTARLELWDKCGEDTLRGLFLQQLRDTCDASDPRSRRLMEQAAAFGLAAIDDREV